MSLCEGNTVLDVGCGTGRTVRYLASAVGSGGNVVGVDFSRPMLMQASCKKLARNAAYLQAEAHLLPVRARSVDAIMCFAAFAHFAQKEAFLREANRVLRTGCKLAICHPMSSTALSEFHKQAAEAIQNHVLPGSEYVVAMAREAGFDVERAVDRTGLYLVVARKSH